jgi:hypothetical protein
MSDNIQITVEDLLMWYDLTRTASAVGQSIGEKYVGRWKSIN